MNDIPSKEPSKPPPQLPSKPTVNKKFHQKFFGTKYKRINAFNRLMSNRAKFQSAPKPKARPKYGPDHKPKNVSGICYCAICGNSRPILFTTGKPDAKPLTIPEMFKSKHTNTDTSRSRSRSRNKKNDTPDKPITSVNPPVKKMANNTIIVNITTTNTPTHPAPTTTTDPAPITTTDPPPITTTDGPPNKNTVAATNAQPNTPNTSTLTPSNTPAIKSKTPAIKVSDSIPEYGGLRNLNATCYQNSVTFSFALLDSLYDILFDINDLMYDKHNSQSLSRTHWNKKIKTVEYMVLLIDGLNSNKFNDTENFVRSHPAPWNSFIMHNDVHAFYLYLVDLIKVIYKTSVNGDKKILRGVLEGIYSSSLTCTSCSYQTPPNYDFFDYISVPMTAANNSVQNGIDNHCKMETLSAANKYDCPTCNQKRIVNKQIALHLTPSILAVHINRFDPLTFHKNNAVKFCFCF